MRGGEVAAEGRAQEFGAHLVQLVDGVADGPDTEVDVAAGADGGVGEREELAGLVPLVEDSGEGGLVGGALGGGQASPLGQELVEAKADDLAAGGRGCGVELGRSCGFAAGGTARGRGQRGGGDPREELCHGSIVSRTLSTGKGRVRRVAVDALLSGGVYRD